MCVEIFSVFLIGMWSMKQETLECGQPYELALVIVLLQTLGVLWTENRWVWG